MCDPARHACLLLIGTTLLAACNELPTDHALQHDNPDAAFTILDGARGGNAQFYFLPPMVPAPTYSGTFDATQSPIVTICELTGNTCGATVTSFSGSAIKIDVRAEAYIATWKTKGAGLDPTKMYRINVLLGTQVLGYADVVVLANGSQIKTVDKNQFVATINGGVLNIRFRIETAPPPPPPPPGVWHNGDVITYTQTEWGDATTIAGGLLSTHFNTLYGTLGYMEVGLSGSAGVSMVFTSAAHVFTYLPSFGPPAPLNANLLNPTSSASGVFGGEVLALQFNIDLSDADFLSGTTNIDIGDLTLCGLAQSGLNGTTVRTFQVVANTALGGGSTPYALADLTAIAGNINASFAGGTPSSFAQAHLVNGACPGIWQNGDLITYIQDDWGAPSTTAGTLLSNNYIAVYAATFGVVEVGLPGASGNSIQFSGANAVFAYLPSSGLPAPLNADLADPISTASGILGGEVLALRINIDFSDAGRTIGSSGLRFGDLTLCNPSVGPSGGSVRAFMDVVNTALGGGTTPYSIDDLNLLTQDLNAAFRAGAPSSFAQTHLVNGTCP